MSTDRDALTERIQRLTAALVATHPAGTGLCLVGGFRYRLLDRAVRRSVDIDYHWTGDLETKQKELAHLFERRLLPDIRRRLNLDGSISAPPAESPAAAVVELACWRLGSDLGRIEIPVDIVRLECLDPPTVRAADGVIYRTASNADMLESKVLAVVSRTFLEHRDLIDLFLFADHAAADASARLARKFESLGIRPNMVTKRLQALDSKPTQHVAAVDRVIREQLDPGPAASLQAAGGGALVVSTVFDLLARLLEPSSRSGP